MTEDVGVPVGLPPPVFRRDPSGSEVRPQPPGSAAASVDSSPPSRRVWLLVAGSIALCAVALGLVVVLAGLGSDEADYSLARAAENAAANTARYELSISVDGMEAYNVSGSVDGEAQLITHVLGEDFNPLGEHVLEGSEIIVDEGNGVLYLHGGPSLAMPGDTSWASGELAGAEQTFLFAGLLHSLDSNPLDLAPLFADARRVIVGGSETIDGLDVVRYRVEVDLDEAVATDPLLEGLEVSDVEGPSVVGYDVWVTEQNQLRRISLSMAQDGTEVRADIDLLDIGQPVDIVLPEPDEVTDL